jgi:undecaprenyl diphosphate synthase
MHLDPLRTEELPRHVAIIMDGNGRWAERRGLSRVEGHRAGKEAVSAVVRAAGELGIEVLTLYAFSIENWNRPQSEVTELMRLAERYLDEGAARGDGERHPGARDRAARPACRRACASRSSTRSRRRATTASSSSCSRSPTAGAPRSSTRRAGSRATAEQGRVEPDAVDEKVVRLLSL